MDNLTAEEGITIGDLCRIVGKRIWYILGISVLFAIIASLVFAFGLNPRTVTYSLEFTLSYPSSETMKYPDGSPFNYRDMISASMLKEAKATDARFAKVDTDRLIEEDGIEISSLTQEVSDSSRFTGTYTVTVKGSFFPSKTVATDFIRAVANVPISRIKTLAGEIDFVLESPIFESASYADRLSLLAEQKEELMAQYEEWITLYRENYYAADKTLKNHSAEVSIIYSDSTQALFAEELENCGYVPVEYLEGRIAELQEERALNANKIAALKEALKEVGETGDSGTQVSLSATSYAVDDDSEGSRTVVNVSNPGMSAMLAQLIVRNEQIDYQLDKLTEENVLEFDARVKAQYDKLQDAAITMKTVASSIYSQQSIVTFSSSKAVEDGGIGIPLAAVAGFVLAFLITAIVFCVKDMPGFKQGKKEQPPVNTDERKE